MSPAALQSCVPASVRITENVTSSIMKNKETERRLGKPPQREEGQESVAREGVKAQSVRTGSPGTPRRRMQTLGRAEGPRTGRPSQGLPRPQTQAAARSAGGLGRSGNVQSRRLLLPSLSPSRPSSHKAHSFARRGGRRCTKDRSVPRHPPPPPRPEGCRQATWPHRTRADEVVTETLRETPRKSEADTARHSPRCRAPTAGS